MALTITNQKPGTLNPLQSIGCAGSYDIEPALTAAMVTPLFQPLNAAQPVSFKDNGQDLDENDVLAQIQGSVFSGSSQPGLEDSVKEILRQSLIHFDAKATLPVNDAFAVQAAQSHRLRAPSPNVIYSAKDDVIPAAKNLLSHNDTPAADLWFASISYTYRPHTLGFWFLTTSAFNDFKTWLATQVAAMGSALPSETTRLLGDFANLSLKGLTESLLLRKDQSEGNDEFSFARVIINQLTAYAREQRDAHLAGITSPGQPSTVPLTMGMLPFAVDQLFVPESLVLANVETHARATAPKVTAEWKLINQALTSPIKVISNRKLNQLTAVARATAQAVGSAASAASNKAAPSGKAGKVVFRKTAASPMAIIKPVMKVLNKMSSVNKSQNVIRTSRVSYRRANRRDPGNYNLPGRVMSSKFMPDLHIFLDTSGSISEANYQGSVMLLIQLAKKMNVNLYISSFSHLLSQETLLKVENRSTKAIWQEFRKIPKVTGGTDFKLVWDYINASPVRQRRMNLMITDFGWYAPSHYVEHPKNLFYAPCAGMDWNRLLHYAKGFTQSVSHIEPAIASRLLGVVK